MAAFDLKPHIMYYDWVEEIRELETEDEKIAILQKIVKSNVREYIKGRNAGMPEEMLVKIHAEMRAAETLLYYISPEAHDDL